MQTLRSVRDSADRARVGIGHFNISDLVARIAAIKQAVHLPMTLHGGSGTKNDDLRQAVKAGMTIVHINTELRLAWRRGVEAGLAAHPEEVAPYKILPAAVQAVHDVVRARLRLFTAP